MNDANAGGIVLAVLSLATIAFIAWRIAVGSSYISRPAMKVLRASDPFSFWMSLAIPALFAFLTAAGSFDLLFAH